jgi:hypothetical protein
MTMLDEPVAGVLPDLPGFVAAVAEHERQTAALALQLHAIERSGMWGLDGSVSIAAWLRGHCRMSTGNARAMVRRGRFLSSYEAFADAALIGVLSASQLEALGHLDKPKHAELLAEHQSELVELVAPMTVADTVAVCSRWRANADAIVDGPEPSNDDQDRHVHLSRGSDGALLGHLQLFGAAATEVEKALRNAATHDGATDERTHGERNADALFDICAFFNKNHLDDGTPRNLPHVSISVDASTLAAGQPEGVVADTHEPIGPQCTDTYLCDCKIHTILRGPYRGPIGFGDSQYTVPRKLFNQIAERDGGCRFPGCDRNVRHCDAHHVRYWRHAGKTDYANLVLLCSRHHHFVHETNVQLKFDDHWRLHVFWHDGRTRTSTPRGAPPTARSKPR